MHKNLYFYLFQLISSLKAIFHISADNFQPEDDQSSSSTNITVKLRGDFQAMNDYEDWYMEKDMKLNRKLRRCAWHNFGENGYLATFGVNRNLLLVQINIPLI